VMHFEHDGGIAIVFNGHSSAKIVCCEHGLRCDRLKSYNVKTLKGDAELTRGRRFCNCRQAHRLPSAIEAVALQ
jgi:hypothetical protein